MATVNLNDLRIKNTKNFLDSLNGPNQEAYSYLFIGRPTAWVTGDNNPPTPQNNFREFYGAYDEMLSCKRIADTDAFYMIPRRSWTSGVVYDIYEDDISSVNTSYSGQSNLYNSNYFVINSNNAVYVCLFNGSNVASTVEPQDLGTDPFYTSDGYQWLKLFTIPTLDMEDHATTDFIPIIQNDVTTGTEGAVNTVLIENGGNGYTNNPVGGFNVLPYFYCKVNGDGTGAVARVTVTLGKISKVEMVRYGAGYTQGTLGFSAGNVYASLPDLDAGINGLNPQGDGTLRTSVVISPPGGWGTDLARELGGTQVGVFVNLTNTEFDFIEDTTFRQIGIIQNPTFPTSTTANSATLSASYAINYTLESGTNFQVGEIIQEEVEVGGVLKKARGKVVAIDDTNKVVKYIQDPFLHVDESDGVLYRFSELAALATTQVRVVGLTSNTVVLPTELTGTLANLTFSAGFAQPEINKYSGLMTYLSNQSPITRTSNQSERISLVIGY